MLEVIGNISIHKVRLSFLIVCLFWDLSINFQVSSRPRYRRFGVVPRTETFVMSAKVQCEKQKFVYLFKRFGRGYNPRPEGCEQSDFHRIVNGKISY